MGSPVPMDRPESPLHLPEDETAPDDAGEAGAGRKRNQGEVNALAACSTTGVHSTKVRQKARHGSKSEQTCARPKGGLKHGFREVTFRNYCRLL